MWCKLAPVIAEVVFTSRWLYDPLGTKIVDKSTTCPAPKSKNIISFPNPNSSTSNHDDLHPLNPLCPLCVVWHGARANSRWLQFNKPDGGPPRSYFAAGSSIPAAALQSAAVKASTPVPDATYPINGDKGAKKVTIYSDWTNLDEVATCSYQ